MRVLPVLLIAVALYFLFSPRVSDNDAKARLAPLPKRRSTPSTPRCNASVATASPRSTAFDMYPMARLLRTAPLNSEMVLNYIAEHVMGLPRSY
jgi:hypothetical protein